MLSLPVILASASPRRKELLSHIIDNFTLEPANIDETPFENEMPCDLVHRLAIGKAKHVAKRHANTLVIGSDTVVAVNNNILGKPLDYKSFLNYMAQLSDTTHKVYTGVCVYNTSCDRSNSSEETLNTDSFVSQVLVTEVTMAKIEKTDALAYWLTGEPKDKAGGYAIQGIGGKFVKAINGSFSAVVGLPIYETQQLINKIIE